MQERKRLKKGLISLLLICSLVSIPPSTAFGEESEFNVQANEQIANEKINQDGIVNEEDQSVISSVTGSSVNIVSSGAIQSEESLSSDESAEAIDANEIILAETLGSDFEIDSDGVLISYSGEGGEVIIPEGVTKIGDRAFSDCINITNISIPNGVMMLGNYVFSGCSGLTSINIPTGVYQIGEYAFSGCSSLTSIIIPLNGISMSEGTFMEINSVPHRFTVDDNKLYYYYGIGGDVIIPNGITKINYTAFTNNDNITSITLPDSVTEIDFEAFASCSNLSSISLPDSVTKIGRRAFENCTSLISINIPASVTKIQDNTFYGCSNLTNVTIPDSVTEIEFHAFNGCSSLTSITLPNSVNKIGVYAFQDCINLKSATLAGNTDSHVFMGCRNLTDVRFLNGAKSIGALTFLNCEKLTNVYIEDSVTVIEACAFQNCYSLENINIPTSLEEIGGAAFMGCNNLESLMIPKGVKSIGNSAFSNCNKLTLFGTTGSVAESYAQLNKIPFIAIANCIVVYDYESGEPIPGAEVIINDISYNTDSEGSVEVAPGILDTLVLNEEGYERYSTTQFAIDTLELYPIGLIPTDVFDSNAYIEKVMLQGTGKHVAFSSNIMNEEVSFLSNTTEKCNITIGTYLGDKVVSKYIITNNGSIILENTTGKFLNVNMSMFKPGTQTFSYIEFTDGTRCKKVELLVRNYEDIR